MRPHLDLDLLRTLVCIAEESSFTRAAERVGRTQSAVTLQIQKLEGLVRQPLVVRSKGGPTELTPQGRALVEKARTMLSLNDEAFNSLGPEQAAANLRLASGAEYSVFFLAAVPRALSRRCRRGRRRLLVPGRTPGPKRALRYCRMRGRTYAQGMGIERTLAGAAAMGHLESKSGASQEASAIVSVTRRLPLAAALDGRLSLAHRASSGS